MSKSNRKRINRAAICSVNPEEPATSYKVSKKLYMMRIETKHQEFLESDLKKEIDALPDTIVYKYRPMEYGIWICGKLQLIESPEMWNIEVCSMKLKFGFLGSSIRIDPKDPKVIVELFNNTL